MSGASAAKILKVQVASTDPSSPLGAEVKADKRLEISLEEKALTLGYDLPSAESEIRRVEDLRSQLRQNLEKKKQHLPTARVDLAAWLGQHGDATLQDLELADSPVPVKSITVDEIVGLGRYVMQGDLKEWIDGVGQLREQVRRDGGEWNSDDEHEVEEAMTTHLKKLLTKDAQVKEQELVKLVSSLSDILSAISSRSMSVDCTAFDSVGQLRQLHSHVLKWREYWEENLKDEVRVQSDARVEDGKSVDMTEAARRAGVQLTREQLDQVLAEFYHRPAPNQAQKQAELSRLKKRLAEALNRESEKTAMLRRHVTAQNEKIDDLTNTIMTLNRELSALKSGCVSDLRNVKELQQTNDQTNAIAEILARRKIREASEEVVTVMEEFQKQKEEHVVIAEKLAQLVERGKNADLSVKRIEELWMKHKTYELQQEERRKAIFGGHKDDQQHFIHTMTSVLGQSISYFSNVLNDPSNARETVAAWATQMMQYAITDSLKIALSELTKLCSNSTRSHPLRDDDLADSLLRRLDASLSENAAKYRESRFMRSTVRYVAQCVEAMCAGTYDEVVHGKRRVHENDDSRSNVHEEPFPPLTVVAPDGDYAYAWMEECKMLEVMFDNLRNALMGTEERVDATNALLAVLDSASSWRTQQSPVEEAVVPLQKEEGPLREEDLHHRTSALVAQLEEMPSEVVLSDPRTQERHKNIVGGASVLAEMKRISSTDVLQTSDSPQQTGYLEALDPRRRLGKAM